MYQDASVQYLKSMRCKPRLAAPSRFSIAALTAPMLKLAQHESPMPCHRTTGNADDGSLSILLVMTAGLITPVAGGTRTEEALATTCSAITARSKAVTKRASILSYCYARGYAVLCIRYVHAPAYVNSSMHSVHVL
jgi:hypothetical protein